MKVLVELGIFDDGDVAPTVVLGMFSTLVFNKASQEEQVKAFADMRRSAEKEYGRAAPDHALFWCCYPNPGDMVAGHGHAR